MKTRALSIFVSGLILASLLLGACGQKEREALTLARGEGTYQAYRRFAAEYPSNSDGQYFLAVVGLVTGRDPITDPVLQTAVETAPDRVRNGYELRAQYRAAVAEADSCVLHCSDAFIDCSLAAKDPAGEVDYPALDNCTGGLGVCTDACDPLVETAREHAEVYSVELGLIEHDASLTILVLEREQIETP
ncbi:MAG: hypothetical protein P9M14_16285 [Candidatus Alcyoniella australis]|nr:hypothetical protein [Candidatus Alcyoniella australis]